MLTLAGTTDTIEVVLGAAHTTNPVQCYATWRDFTATSATPGRTVINTNGTATVVAVAAPAAATQRVIDTISIFNADTVTQTVTVRYDANATEYSLVKVILLTGEMLMLTDGAGWQTYTASGVLKFTQQSSFTPVATGWTTVVLSADVTNANATANTIADVTGLSWSATLGQRYVFRALIFYTSAASTTGSRWSISGPAAPTELFYRSEYSLTVTTRTVNEGQSAYDLPAASNATSAATAANVASIEGLIMTSATGTVIVRFASEVLSSAIVAKRGSILQYMAV